MPEYNFDQVIDRRNSNSLKWDVEEDQLPMWVADMDFQTAPEIRQAIARRAEHGIFGYSIVPGQWYLAYQGWWEKRHHFHMEKHWLMFVTGVVPAISSAVRKLTTPGENVLIQTPVYNIFFNSIVNNGRNVLESPLKYRDGAYEIDFGDLEEKLADPQTTMMILCNPQNPVGKIWDRETLARIGALCRKHHVIVLSDEIHCDLTAPGREYIPFASVSEDCRENSVTCLAPTKAFNLAGLQTAAIMVPNEALRNKMHRAINTDEVAEPNAFAVEAAVAAFTKGEAWLDALRAYIEENRRLAKRWLAERIPKLWPVDGEATYLLWLDCREVLGDATELAGYLRKTTGLYVSEGAQYGRCGAAFLRLNIACPRETLEDGLRRLETGVPMYEEWAVSHC
ncbi:MAG TPA: pyridoxal phosphate-dependent aminotransferase [Candidatus Ventrisoma faecale]|nr:pyridoxal phosphate-dependent aminotransferase [Candidatus Ventrisoma faecale]